MELTSGPNEFGPTNSRYELVPTQAGLVAPAQARAQVRTVSAITS